jgi:hypothetical protein
MQIDGLEQHASETKTESALANPLQSVGRGFPTVALGKNVPLLETVQGLQTR